MCWMCDRPGATERDYLDHMRQLIRTYGWAVQGVEREGLHPPWAYTVGLTRHRRPELVITGLGLTRGQRAGDGGARPTPGLRGQEKIEGLFEAALEQVGISGERNRRGCRGAGPQRNVEAMDGVEKEERPHAFVEVVAGAAKAVQRLALGEQFFERQLEI